MPLIDVPVPKGAFSPQRAAQPIAEAGRAAGRVAAAARQGATSVPAHQDPSGSRTAADVCGTMDPAGTIESGAR